VRPPAEKRGAGKYCRRITIQQPTRGTADDGQRTATWSTYATLWADVEPLAGSESHTQQRLQEDQPWEIRVRSSTLARAITADMRILLSDGTTLGIGAVRDLGRAKMEVAILGTTAKR
jgi:SPP1 family predicted phage head-tail adaptor